MMRWNAKSLSAGRISPTMKAIQIIWLKGKPIQKLIKNPPWQLKYWANCFSACDRMLAGWQPNDAAGSLHSTPVCWVIDGLWVQRSKVVGEFAKRNFTVEKSKWWVFISCHYFSTRCSKRKAMLHSELVSYLHSTVYENL